MFFCCECCELSGTGLCDGLITRQEEAYRLWCVGVYGLETSKMRRPWPTGGCCTPKKSPNQGIASRAVVNRVSCQETGLLFLIQCCFEALSQDNKWCIVLIQIFRTNRTCNKSVTVKHCRKYCCG